MMACRPITWDEVFYETNVELGLTPYCHECTSHLARKAEGYVHICRDGFQTMHRWVYWKTTGDIPEQVNHLCNNPVCINMAHLVAGTALENSHYMVECGRLVHAKNAGKPRSFSNAQVQNMHRLKKSGLYNRQIAEIYPAAVSTIARITSGKHYQDAL